METCSVCVHKRNGAEIPYPMKLIWHKNTVKAVSRHHGWVAPRKQETFQTRPSPFSPKGHGLRLKKKQSHTELSSILHALLVPALFTVQGNFLHTKQRMEVPRLSVCAQKCGDDHSHIDCLTAMGWRRCALNFRRWARGAPMVQSGVLRNVLSCLSLGG